MWFRKKKEEAAIPEGATWRAQPIARIQDARDGQTVEYPARLAVCPRGHTRSLPTRFDRPVTSLRCNDCARSYPIEL